MKRIGFIIIALLALNLLYSPVFAQTDMFKIAGTKEVVTVHSPALEGNLLGDSPDRPVTVYLPPGYGDSPGNRYPVIYFLHGILCDHLTFFGDYIPEQDFQVILDRMLNTVALPPVILVSPNSYNALKGSFYTNSNVTGQWEDYIVKDVIAYVDENYRTIPSRESRGLSGHSMGGYGTMKLAMDHPSLFNAAYALSPYGLILEEFIFDVAFEDIKQAVTAKTQEELTVNGQSMVMQAAAFAPDSAAEPFFGQFPLTESGEPVESVLQKWLMYDPYTKLPARADSLRQFKAIQYDCGTVDEYGFYPVCVAFSDTLDKYGIDHVFESYEGDHGNRLVERIEERLIPFFWSNLHSDAPGIARVSPPYLAGSDTLVVEMDRDGTIYIVPGGSPAIMDTILSRMVAVAEADSGAPVAFPLADLALGKYTVYGLSTGGSSFSVPLPIAIDTKAGIPVFSVAEDTVTQGEKFVFQCDKTGTIYIANPGTTPENIHQTARIKASAEVTAGIPVEIETSELYPKTYVVLVRDQYELFSEPQMVHVLADPTSLQGTADAVSRIYPNPVSEILHIEMESEGTCQVDIHSLTGKLLYGTRMEGSSMALEVSPLKSGIIFITIRSKDFVTTRKIVKL